MLLGAFAFLASGLGSAVFRPLLYMGFFSTPALITRLGRNRLNLPNRGSFSTAQIVLVLFLLSTAFPVFLVYNSNIASAGYTPQDLATGNYISGIHLGELQIYGVTNSWPFLQFYTLFDKSAVPMATTFVGWQQFARSSIGVSTGESEVMNNFENSQYDNPILMYSEYQWTSPIQIYSGNLNLSSTVNRLNLQFLRVYDNGPDQLYTI
jgi:hypothetical protein